VKRSPRAADVATSGDKQGPQGLPRLDEARPDNDRIAQRAYERYQERGGEPGRDWEDWFEAEREIRERSRDKDGPALRVNQ
jgi:hypothetical protein